MQKKSTYLRTAHRFFAVLFTWLLAMAAPAQDSDSLAGKVAVISIDEFTLVEAAQIEFLQETLKRVRAEGATAAVLEIDSPGGFAIATRRVVEELGAMTGVKTLAFIKGDAIGGPALVALATDEIYFSPDGKIGSSKSEPIEWRGKTTALPDRLVEKTYADYADTIKKVVVAKGRDAVLVDGLIDPAIEVKLGDTVLAEADDVLVFGGSSPVAAGTVESVAAALKASGITGDIVEFNYAPQAEVEAVAAERETSVEPDADEEVGFGESKQESYAGKVVVIEVGKESLIRKTKFEFMRRILKKADEDRAEAVIFSMSTPGGYLWETRDLMNDLQDVTIPTYTYVNPEASSAGAMIAIATDKIYMKEPSTIGAAAIVAGGEGIDGTMREKVERTLLDTVVSMAELKGRDAELCQAFVRPELEYSRSIPAVESDGSLGSRPAFYVKAGELLSLRASEATAMIDGKPLFADGLAQSIEELVEKEGLKGEVVDAQPFGFEAVADWIVKIAPFLLLLAMAGAYLEVNSPGFGVPGIMALVFFAIFFFGHNVAGKLAGYEVVGVFVLGLILIAVELFLLPGMMIFGILGMLMVVGSLLFAMIDQFDFTNVGGSFDFERLLGGLGTPVVNLMIGLAGAAILVAFLMRYLPELPFMQRRMLAGVTSGGSGGSALTSVSGGTASSLQEELVGLEGTAQCDLRPVGKGMFGDRLLDVTTGSEFVEAGAALRIVEAQGARIVVEKA